MKMLNLQGMRPISREDIKSLMVVVAIIILGAAIVYANSSAAGGFDKVWLALKDYMQGALGRVIVGLIVVVGVAAAIIRQSLMVFAVAVGGAIGMFYSPDIIEGLLTSTEAMLTTLPAVGI